MHDVQTDAKRQKRKHTHTHTPTDRQKEKDGDKFSEKIDCEVLKLWSCVISIM